MNYITITYPLTDDKERNSFLKRAENIKEALKSKLFFLFTTEIGERFYNRGYGSKLKRFIFDPNDNITLLDVETDIKDTVNKFLPNIIINNIDIQNTNNDNGIMVIINFTYNEEFFNFSDTIIINF